MSCSRSCVREQPRGYVPCWHRNNCITAFCRLNEMTCKDPLKSGHFCWVSYFTRILGLEILHLNVHYLMFHPGPDNLLIWLYQSEAAHYGYRHHKTQGQRKQNLDKKKKKRLLLKCETSCRSVSKGGLTTSWGWTLGPFLPPTAALQVVFLELVSCLVINCFLLSFFKVTVNIFRHVCCGFLLLHWSFSVAKPNNNPSWNPTSVLNFAKDVQFRTSESSTHVR